MLLQHRCIVKICQTWLIHAKAINNLILINEPCREKTCHWGFRPRKTESGLLRYIDKPESWNFGFSKYRYYTIYIANNIGADQTARMCRLICSFVVRIWPKQVFSWCGSNNFYFQIQQHLFSCRSREDIPVVTVIKCSQPRLRWWNMRESILERNLTAVRSVGNHLTEEKTWKCINCRTGKLLCDLKWILN